MKKSMNNKYYTNLKCLFGFALLACTLSASLTGCKDEVIEHEVGPQVPETAKTVEQINANCRALQRIVVATQKGTGVKSCIALSKDEYNVELADGNTFRMNMAIADFGKGDGGPAQTPLMGVDKFDNNYYWTLDGDWLTVGGNKVIVSERVAANPVMGINAQGYWTVKVGDNTLALNRIVEGKQQGIFSKVDLSHEGQVAFGQKANNNALVLSMSGRENPDKPIMGYLRRPISPDQPAWLIGIDSWSNPDPQKIIDLIPKDVLPYVIFNIALSISHNSDGSFARVEYGYETAKSWLRTCAENNVWAMIQPASGGWCHFPDYALYSDMENSLFEEFYRDYPNFLGYNYCEQFWGFNTDYTPTYKQRLEHFTNLMKLNKKYGGYLVISFCNTHYGAGLMPVGMFKQSPTFAEECKSHPENLIVCEKFTSVHGFLNNESLCLGAWLSGYAGHYGMRFDSSGWWFNDNLANGPLWNWNNDKSFPVATGIAPQIEHTLLTGQTVYDGPELTSKLVFKKDGTESIAGYTERKWSFIPQMENISMDIFRKVIDGTIRILSRKEVIERTKVVIINDIPPQGTNSDIGYIPSPTLFDGLYKIDEDGTKNEQHLWFKKTGRYPAIPMVYGLADDLANTFEIKINASGYEGAYGDIEVKQAKFNRLFPEEYKGNMYVGRHENAWVAYNPYGDVRNATVPFKYNTTDHMELAFSKYSTALIKEYADKVTFYVNNYKENGPKIVDVIKIAGCNSQPSMSFVDRASLGGATVEEAWADGIYTMTISHNGPLDITVACAGNATGREIQATAATISVPKSPQIYHGARQYEAENFGTQNVEGIIEKQTSDYYTGLGYLNVGSAGNAAVRDEVSVVETGNYVARFRYRAETATINNVELYVNGIYVQAMNFAQTDTAWSVASAPIQLNTGKNSIELKADGNTLACTLYLDNLVIE